MKTLNRLLLLGCLAGTAALAVSEAAAAADAVMTATPARKAVKKVTAKHKAVKPVDKAGALVDDDGKEYKAGNDTATEFDCELGNKLTLYSNAADEEHMALRWQQRVHRMTRVSTSTGANRFENSRYGLVWIGIPAKGMLLDSKRGQQLANECKDAERKLPKPASLEALAAPAMPAAPALPVAPASPASPMPPVEVPRTEPAAKS